MSRQSASVRSYWDERARLNAAFFVDTGDPYGRERPQFLGSRVHLSQMDDARAEVGLQRVACATPDSSSPGAGRSPSAVVRAAVVAHAATPRRG